MSWIVPTYILPRTRRELLKTTHVVPGSELLTAQISTSWWTTKFQTLSKVPVLLVPYLVPLGRCHSCLQVRLTEGSMPRPTGILKWAQGLTEQRGASLSDYEPIRRPIPVATYGCRVPVLQRTPHKLPSPIFQLPEAGDSPPPRARLWDGRRPSLHSPRPAAPSRPSQGQ